mmetsp:Transcript_41209/g.89811  ORF Transcript_41209/g.89811 Transcript_41209/m.89811 type:complete len:568 (-) Transcript_41209:100-1803(-)
MQSTQDGYGEPPVAHEGGHVDQATAARETEDLQDYVREREGHLIIRDDRPFLIMSFGTLYSGPHASKYKWEGKYHIPVGYKAIVKWDEDEIVFMTRQGEFGPEFQIMYLPKSAAADDFTQFDWNGNIAEIWDELLTVLETQDKDMTMFLKGPFYTFGITEDTVQINVEKGQEEHQVEGILYCANGSQSTVEEYKSYLGLQPDIDEHYLWICHEFMNDPLPLNFYQYTSNGMTYWVDARTQESTWKHPHYNKYKKMLSTARLQRPLPHWKSIMSFQIEFLFSNLFTWECEATGQYPPVETVENVLELARIFKVDVRAEPYLVHVLKRALRHYSAVVREKRAVADVEDFRNLMHRYRDIVAQFDEQKQVEASQMQSLMKCVECPDPKRREDPPKQNAVIYCDDCNDLFCQSCFERLHAKGRRKEHRRTWVELGVCAECEEALAIFHCVQCQDAYCKECFQEWHTRGGRRNHAPIVLRSFNPASHRTPMTRTFADQGAVTTGSAAALNLARALSPWLEFEDESQIKLFYNIHTGETRRDPPPASTAWVNEPLEQSVGGGIHGSWAGNTLG